METHEPELAIHSFSPAQLPSEIALLPLPPNGIGASTVLAELTHEARNMVTMLGLYCELLDQPGVLASGYQHYGNELKMVAAACRSLVERMGTLDRADGSVRSDAGLAQSLSYLGRSETTAGRSRTTIEKQATMPPLEDLNLKPIADFAWELQTNRNLLAALAGPSVIVTIDAIGGALPVRMSSEDLTRILVNLVKNAIEAMPCGGRIQLVLRETQTGAGEPPKLTLNVEDSGSGIPTEALENVFSAGFTTRSTLSGGVTPRRGLGLSITRSIVEASGGCVRAANRDPHGSCFQIELPAGCA